MSYSGLKRLIDIVLAATAFVLLLPLLFGIAVAVRLAMGRPVLFSQLRPGRNGQLFRMYKFRTMRDDRDADGNLMPDRQRVTTVGSLLRKSSLDELPELWNVLRGDMSLVGPRPLLPEYLPHYTEREQMRHSVRPGITGLAQVSGRNRLGWDERLELDVQYSESYSLWLDLKIVAVTIYKVLLGRDVSLETQLPFHLHRDGGKSGNCHSLNE